MAASRRFLFCFFVFVFANLHPFFFSLLVVRFCEHKGAFILSNFSCLCEEPLLRDKGVRTDAFVFSDRWGPPGGPQHHQRYTRGLLYFKSKKIFFCVCVHWCAPTPKHSTQPVSNPSCVQRNFSFLGDFLFRCVALTRNTSAEFFLFTFYVYVSRSNISSLSKLSTFGSIFSFFLTLHQQRRFLLLNVPGVPIFFSTVQGKPLGFPFHTFFFVVA